MVTKEFCEDSRLQLSRDACVDLVSWDSEQSIAVFLDKPRVKLGLYLLVLLRDGPQSIEIFRGKDVVACDVAGEFDDFVHKLENGRG